jgi:hypothetical protein
MSMINNFRSNSELEITNPSLPVTDAILRADFHWRQFTLDLKVEKTNTKPTCTQYVAYVSRKWIIRCVPSTKKKCENFALRFRSSEHAPGREPLITTAVCTPLHFNRFLHCVFQMSVKSTHAGALVFQTSVKSTHTGELVFQTSVKSTHAGELLFQTSVKSTNAGELVFQTSRSPIPSVTVPPIPFCAMGI